MSRLVVVTASTNPNRAVPCLSSWGPVDKILVLNGPQASNSSSWRQHVGNAVTLEQQEYLGTVAAFKAGVDYALETTDAEVIANLHDDLIISDIQWVEKVLRRFDQQKEIGLLGFGGAIGLGADNIYQVPYQPQQLARIGFRSNLQDAEVHGVRSLLAERVTCLDGFSQIGRREFWMGDYLSVVEGKLKINPLTEREDRPWDVLDTLGVHHHGYDGMLACLAARYGWETWYLPIRCRHLGGATAVGDQGYQSWAKTKDPMGDQGFWQAAHQIWYDNFRDVLPLRV